MFFFFKKKNMTKLFPSKKNSFHFFVYIYNIYKLTLINSSPKVKWKDYNHIIFYGHTWLYCVQQRWSNCSGKPLEFNPPNSTRKSISCGLLFPGYGKSGWNWVTRSQAPKVFFYERILKKKKKLWGRFNDCKAYCASRIYSLAPRETVSVRVVVFHCITITFFQCEKSWGAQRLFFSSKFYTFH